MSKVQVCGLWEKSLVDQHSEKLLYCSSHLRDHKESDTKTEEAAFPHVNLRLLGDIFR